MTDQNLNQIMKIGIHKFKNNALNINNNQLLTYTTLMQESELLRIIKHLNPDNKKPISKNSKYPFIKDIIIIDVGDNTKLYINCDGYLKFNGDKFKRLMASSSNIRNSKAVFVRESLFDKVNDILLGGLPNDLRYDVLAKFSSYYALCSTDSIPVLMPRIVIVDDYTHEIDETFDLVKETAKGLYEVENDQKYKTRIKAFDGAGLVTVEFAKIWSKELGINLSNNENENKKIIPASWQFRAIPCLKGNVYTFDLTKYAQEKGILQITDLWGKAWDIFDAEGNLLIDVVLTKSQFKFHKQYKSYETWLNAFNIKTYNYERRFNISGYSDAKHLSDKVVLSYQPLQTLSFDKQEVTRLCYKTVERYRKIATNVDEFIKYRGLVDKIDAETCEIKKEKVYVPAFYQALKENKDLFNDTYIQSKIKNDLKGFKKRSYKGMLFLNGSYQTLIPDLVALAEYALGLPVRGVLRADEVYNQYFSKVDEIALCRFPHISREWKVAKIVNPDFEDTKYLDYVNEGYVINIWDSTPLRLGGADFDGDHIYGIIEQTILNALDKQESNTILHIPPKPLKEKKGDTPLYPINDMEKLIETDCRGMEGNIGKCVNDITKLWSLPETEERDKYIKIMSVIGSQIIDYAKTGVRAETPFEIRRFLSKHKLPYFMQYKYPRELKSEKRINKNRNIRGLELVEKLNRNNCTVNSISWYLEQQFALVDKEAETQYNDNFEWQRLLEEYPNIYSNTYRAVKSMMEDFQRQHSELSQQRVFETQPQDIDDNNYKYKILYDYARNSLITLCRSNVNLDKILDYLLVICYTDNKYTDKAILWNCFPDEMIARTKGEYHEEKVFETKVFVVKAEKAKEKLKQSKKNSEQVNTKIRIDPELKDKNDKVVYLEKSYIDLNNINVTVYESEIDYINNAKIPLHHKRVLLVLLVLNKLHKNNSAKFYICPGKKNKITAAHICKLADIEFRKYETIMTELYKGGFYKSPSGNNNLLIDVTFMSEDENNPVFIITSINNIKKHSKNTLTKHLKTGKL